MTLFNEQSVKEFVAHSRNNARALKPEFFPLRDFSGKEQRLECQKVRNSEREIHTQWYNDSFLMVSAQRLLHSARVVRKKNDRNVMSHQTCLLAALNSSN